MTDAMTVADLRDMIKNKHHAHKPHIEGDITCGMTVSEIRKSLDKYPDHYTIKTVIGPPLEGDNGD